MADEAFALSPISARAAAPSEADYDAIREAFMETARGRWFLGEYAKRNRNADTRMVLDAVARIEETIAAQRQPPPPDNRLPEALDAIKGALQRAEGKAAAAIDAAGLEEALAPIRKGTRVIKEISWRWREIGADGRICDLIDSQVAAIETGCGKIAEVDRAAALRAAFEEIRAEIEAFRDDGAPAPPATAEPLSMASSDDVGEASIDDPAPPSDAPASEVATAEIVDAEADAHDEAVLDLVAAEMAASDPINDEEFLFVEPEDAHIAPDPVKLAAEPIAAAPEPIARAPAPEVAPPPVEFAPPTASRAAMVEPQPRAAADPSLGSMILANGILPKREPAVDPLAPIRRMTQAEKIAFFS
jgi:hypothetical protein